MKSSACIEMLFTEAPFLERIALAAKAGFDGIEFWGAENKDMAAIKARSQKAGIAVAGFVANRGGNLSDAAQHPALIAGVQESLSLAREMGTGSLILLADSPAPSRAPSPLSLDEKCRNALAGLKALAPLAEKAGVTLVLEALNSRVDHAGYFVDRSDIGLRLVRGAASPRIKLLYDVYHMQIMEGNIIQTLTGNLDAIGHVHVADVPGRHEPGTGELNYARIFSALRTAGYKGYVGCEYKPSGASDAAAASTHKLLRGMM